MSSLRLDFVSHARARPSLWIMTVSLILLGSALVERYQLISKLEELNQRIAGVEQEIVGLQNNLPSSVQALDPLKGFKQTMDVPWERAISALQRSSGKKILLDKLQSATGNTIVVNGRAETGEEFVGYLQRLDETKEFKHITPVSQHKDEQSKSLITSGVVFEVAVVWE